MLSFQNINYQTREIILPYYGNVLISVNALNNKLLNDNGGYVSDEAAKIDEEIFYFVEENEIITSDFKLKKTIINQLKW